MSDRFLRTEMLLGTESMKILKNSRVAVFGAGGVGGYVIEALARSGVGKLDIIDNDTVSISNINRQILATNTTIGMQKTEVARDRVKQINPNAVVNIYNTFYLPENAEEFDFSQYDYIVDAIDTVSGKIQLVMQAKMSDVPIICSMGAGNKLDATAFRVADIYQTSICPLAKVMRRELKKRGVEKLKVVYSQEVPLTPAKCNEDNENNRRQTPGSVAFVPSVVGLIIAGEVVKDLINR